MDMYEQRKLYYYLGSQKLLLLNAAKYINTKRQGKSAHESDKFNLNSNFTEKSTKKFLKIKTVVLSRPVFSWFHYLNSNN